MSYTIQIALPLQDNQSVKQWRSGVVFRTRGLSQLGILAQWVSARPSFYILG